MCASLSTPSPGHVKQGRISFECHADAILEAIAFSCVEGGASSVPTHTATSEVRMKCIPVAITISTATSTPWCHSSRTTLTKHGDERQRGRGRDQHHHPEPSRRGHFEGSRPQLLRQPTESPMWDHQLTLLPIHRIALTEIIRSGRICTNTCLMLQLLASSST